MRDMQKHLARHLVQTKSLQRSPWVIQVADLLAPHCAGPFTGVPPAPSYISFLGLGAEHHPGTGGNSVVSLLLNPRNPSAFHVESQKPRAKALSC